MDKRTAVRRVMIAGTGSGCGKTTMTCALLRALVNRGNKTGSFKCGPDYIDTMFHAKITGSPCANLDPFFFDTDQLRYILAKNGEKNEVNIIEGVMGYYDGLGMDGTASTYEVSKKTDTPVVLVVGAKGASLSILAVIHGFLDFYKDNKICGVILNNCSQMIYPQLAEEIEKRFEGRVRPLGFLPPMPDCALESRHLGLVTAAEVKDLDEKLEKLAEKAEETIDIDGLLRLADEAEELEYVPPVIRTFERKINIAVAKDEAFCFYYEDSLDVLREMGAALIPFSPLRDAALPENIQGLYLGGGYPELYTKELSENTGMLHSVRDALLGGLPCIAECGGFMYLTASIAGTAMADFLPGNCYNKGKLTRFGYITLTAERDNMLCKAGETIKAHEFHHWDCTDNGNDFRAKKPTGRTWPCIHAGDHLYAGFPHFHFLANLSFAEHFYECCQSSGRKHLKK